MLKKIWNAVTWVLVAAAVAIALSLAVARFFGAGAYAVLSGSMEPTYPVGSLIYDAKVNPSDLQVGDPVTFALSNSSVATHRIVEIHDQDGELSFTTKGDANAQPDAQPLDSRNVIGKPVLSVPLLGYLVTSVQQPPGLYVLVALIAALLLASLIPTLLKKE